MFTKTQLETIEALLVEALGNRKREEKAVSKKEQAVFFKVQEVLSRGANFRKFSPMNDKGHEYIDGTYRLWRQSNGSIRLKLDKEKELYYISKETDIFDRFEYLFEMYNEMEFQKSQEINLDVMEEADDEYGGADQD